MGAETCKFYRERLKDSAKVERAERDLKLKMSLVFRWYLSKSSGWANRGEAERKADNQIWCGPAIGSYNEFAKDTYLDPAATSEYPSVVDINLELLRGACFARRAEQLRRCDPDGRFSLLDIGGYQPPP